MSESQTHITAPTVQAAIARSCKRNETRLLYAEALPDAQWRTLSAKDFLSLARRSAHAMIKAGVNPGDRVALIATNSYLWTATHTGILLAGAIALPLDARLSTDEIANVFADCNAALAIYDNDSEQAVISANPAHAIGMKTLTENITEPADNLPGEDSGNKSDTACMLYTSGTTGRPKAVILSHANLLSDVDALSEAGIISGTDNVMSLLPLHHTYSYMCTFLAPMLLGACITAPEELKGPSLISASRQRGVTIIPAVPQLLELFHMRAFEKIGAMSRPLAAMMRLIVHTCGLARRITGVNIMGIFKKAFGSQFRFLTSGGARLDPTVMTQLEALGFTIVEGYGLTETSPIVAFNPPDRRRAGSVGKAVHGAEIKIISPSNTQTGEIAIKGPMVTSGYYNNPEETERAFKDGWFLSGDLGKIDRNGYLRITGRIKEIIVLSSGKNVYPEEVERHYLSCPLIKEICVYEDKGQLKAAIVPDYAYMKDHSIGNAAEAIRWQMDLLSKSSTPHNRVLGYVLRSEPLPRTPLGKIQRFIVHRQANEQKQPRRSDDGSMDKDEISRRLQPILSGITKSDSPIVRASDNLELDLGIDSLLRLALTVSLEREFSVKLPDDFMGRMHTAGELAEGITKMIAGGSSVKRTGDSDEASALSDVLDRNPSDKDLSLAGFNIKPIDRIVTFILYHSLKAFAKIYFRLDTRGLDNLPPAPYIIAPNHTSYLDPFIMGLCLPYSVFKEMRFIGYEQFFRNPFARYIAQLAHLITIDPEVNLSSALSMSAHCLKNNVPLMLFPEGGRSMDGNLIQFKPGVGILSIKLGVPVIPVYLDGTHQALPKGAAFPSPIKISVNFDKPMAVQDEQNDTDEFSTFAEKLKERILKMSNR